VRFEVAPQGEPWALAHESHGRIANERWLLADFDAVSQKRSLAHHWVALS